MKNTFKHKKTWKTRKTAAPLKKLSDPLVKSEKGEAAVQKSNIAQRKKQSKPVNKCR